MNPLEQILEAIAMRVRQVVQEELAAHGPAATELVTPREYARDYSIAVSTVRQMIKDGRIEAIKIGKRQWRVRRDAPIGQPLLRTRVSCDSPPDGEPPRTAPNIGGAR